VWGPAFQLWPKFTGAIVDPVVGGWDRRDPSDRLPAIAQPRFLLSFFGDRYNRPAQAVDRHAVRLVQASKILRRVSTGKIR
jgi:hypothetical protein